MGINEAIVEKDFWVCWTLDYSIGTIKLMPPEHNRQTLMDDYKHMASMIFGNQPSSHELFAKIQRLEDDINFIT